MRRNYSLVIDLFFLVNFVQFSCNKCPTVTAKPTTQKPTTQKPTTQKPNTQAPSGCKDDNEHCDYWSKNGHCESSKDYMNENCKKRLFLY